MTKGKVTAYIIAGIVFLLSALMIAFYMALPEKVVDVTVYSGKLANVQSEDDKWIVNVDYYSNHNNTGIEMFELKMTYYMDESQINAENPALYSKGVQILGDKEGSINFDYTLDGFGFADWFSHKTRYYHYETSNKVYYYDSNNGISFASLENLSANDMFKISIGSDSNAENYLMKFIGKDNDAILSVHGLGNSEHGFGGFGGYSLKNNYDLNWFIAKLLAVAKQNSLGYGISGQNTLDFKNMFAYKKLQNGSYTGDWLQASSIASDKIIVNFNNYFTIKLTTHENGANKASDSMFGMIQGKLDYQILDSAIRDDYFHGEQTITLNENDFDYLVDWVNNAQQSLCLLKFKTDTVNRINNSGATKISIVINRDVLDRNNIILQTIASSNFHKDSAFYDVYRKIDSAILQWRNSSTGQINTAEVKI